MKNILILSSIFLLSAFCSVNAQTATFTFEDGVMAPWSFYSSTTTIVANPSATGINTSSKVVKLVSTSNWPGFAQYDIKTSKNTLSMQAYSPVETTVTMTLANSVSGKDNFQIGKTIAATDVNKWIKLDFDLSTLTVTDHTSLIFLIQSGTIYYDNIVGFSKIATGLNDNLLVKTINVFPNPSKGSVNLDLSSLNSKATLKIYDLAGKLVFTKNELSNTLHFIELNLIRGIYTMSIESEQKITNSKLVIN